MPRGLRTSLQLAWRMAGGAQTPVWGTETSAEDAARTREIVAAEDPGVASPKGGSTTFRLRTRPSPMLHHQGISSNFQQGFSSPRKKLAATPDNIRLHSTFNVRPSDMPARVASAAGVGIQKSYSKCSNLHEPLLDCTASESMGARRCRAQVTPHDRWRRTGKACAALTLVVWQ